jgi:hypothetical protein
MQSARESKKVRQKSVDRSRINPSPAANVSNVVPDDSVPPKPVIETFFLGTYSNPQGDEQGVHLFYAYFDLQNNNSDIIDLVRVKVDLDDTKKLQITDHDPNQARGAIRIFRNFPERYVSNILRPSSGHKRNVKVTGAADSANGTLN